MKPNLHICTQLRNEEKRIEEWIEYHVNLPWRVKTFTIFNDNSNDNTFNILEKLSNQYSINVITTGVNGAGFLYPINTHPNVYGCYNIFHETIVSNYNKGLKLLQNNSTYKDDWAAFIEVDEFLKFDTDGYPDFNTFLQKNVTDEIHRLWVPSYDMEDTFDLNKPLLSQDLKTWSDETYNKYFPRRAKSIIRLATGKTIKQIHDLDSSPCLRTSSGGLKNDDPTIIAQLHRGIRINHYRKPGLLDKNLWV